MVPFNKFRSTIAVVFLLTTNKESSFCFSLSTSSKGTESRARSRNISISKHAVSVAISIALTTATTTKIPPGVASATTNTERGKVLFTQNCASCHLNGENVMNPKKDLKKETLLKYIGSASSAPDVLDEGQIVSWIEKSGQHKRLF